MLLNKININMKEGVILNTKDLNLNFFPSNKRLPGCVCLKYLDLKWDNYIHPTKTKIIKNEGKLYFSKRYMVKEKKHITPSCFRIKNTLYFIHKTNLLKKFHYKNSLNYESLYEIFFELDEIEKFLFENFFF